MLLILFLVFWSVIYWNLASIYHYPNYVGYAAWLLSPSSVQALKPSPQTVDPDQDRSGSDPGEPNSKRKILVPKSWWNGTRTDPKETGRFRSHTRTDLFSSISISLCFHHLNLQFQVAGTKPNNQHNRNNDISFIMGHIWIKYHLLFFYCY